MWQLPTSSFAIAPGEVHLWRGLCPSGAEASVRLLATAEARLSALEMARARRLATEALRQRYLQAHLLLHTLLVAYAHAGTCTCELGYEGDGKPFLRAPQLEPRLEFNMSHAAEVVVIALARGMAVGIDVEAVHPIAEFDELVARSCTPSEQSHLAGLAAAARLNEFYRIWTRKEAWLKLKGSGLAVNLQSVEVLLPSPEVTLCDLPPTELVYKYIGTLALEAGRGDVSLVVNDAIWKNI